MLRLKKCPELSNTILIEENKKRTKTISVKMRNAIAAGKLVFLLLFFQGSFYSQNLVPNGDFEEYSQIPKLCDEVNKANGWMKLRGSPDFYHTDGYFSGQFSPIKPFSGKGQAGLCTWVNEGSTFRECIFTRLKMPMVKGERYIVSFYLSNGKNNVWTYTTGNFGIYFSKEEVKKGFDALLLLQPQCEVKEQIVIKNGWKKYTFSYTAEDEMEYMSVGNFRSNDSTNVSSKGNEGAYYFVDKIEVVAEKNSKNNEITAQQNNEAQSTNAEAAEMIEQKYDATNKSTKATPVKESARR
jgi:hypothetical protein